MSLLPPGSSLPSLNRDDRNPGIDRFGFNVAEVLRAWPITPSTHASLSGVIETCLAFGFGPESPSGVEWAPALGVATEEYGLSPAADVRPAEVADEIDRRWRLGIDGRGGESSEIRWTLADVKLGGSADETVDFRVFRTAKEDDGRALRADPGRDIGVDRPLFVVGVIVVAGEEYAGEEFVGRPWTSNLPSDTVRCP